MPLLRDGNNAGLGGRRGRIFIALFKHASVLVELYDGIPPQAPGKRSNAVVIVIVIGACQRFLTECGTRQSAVSRAVFTRLSSNSTGLADKGQLEIRATDDNSRH